MIPALSMQLENVQLDIERKLRGGGYGSGTTKYAGSVTPIHQRTLLEQCAGHTNSPALLA